MYETTLYMCVLENYNAVENATNDVILYTIGKKVARLTPN